MNPFIIQFKSIQLKIALWTGCCLLLVAVATIAYAAHALRNTALEVAQATEMTTAQAQAATVDAEIELAFDAARTLAQVLSAIKAEDHPVQLSRDEVNTILRQVLMDNPQFLGTYTLWEPNAFDGQDARYANTEGHDATGRFIPYWNRNERGEIQLEPVMDYETEGIGDYYQCPKRTKQECIINPFTYPVQGEEVLMTSVVVPIIVKGRFYGIAGVDMRLDFLQQLADQAKIHGGAGRLSLISHNGTLAAVTGRPELIGQPMTALHPEFGADGTLARLQKGEEIIKDQADSLEVLVPIRFGKANTPWSVNASVPLQAITAQATTLMWQLIGIGALFGGLGLGLVWIIAGQIAKPIKEITGAAQAITAGNLDVEVTVKEKDETGILANAFNEMAKNLRRRIEAEKVATEKATQLAEAERTAKEDLERTVNNYMTFIERVAGGDLTARLSLNGTDDTLTILGRNLNKMVERLAEMTTQIRQASANISAAAAEILASTTQQASGASEQSAAVSQTSTTIDEVKTIVEQAYLKVQAVAEQAQRTRDISQAGQQAVGDTIDSMNQIKEKVEGVAENILALSEQTQQIGEIIAAVNDIAAQSNLLALNASVEAARAGEHGRGFAVVAVEVRNLAEQSKQATAQVKHILNEIQRATNAAVMATEEGTKRVDAGTQCAEQAGETIQQLAASISESAGAAQQIAASAQQQTTGMEQIALATQNINQATMQNLASTRQAEQSAQNLSSVARQLESLVARYKLN